MKPSTTYDVLDLMDGFVTSAALGAAMELGLFWLLDARSMTRDEVAAELGVPPFRCGYWLEILVELGLVDESSQGYTASATARNAILKAYSRETWALLSEELREGNPVLSDLARLAAHPEPDSTNISMLTGDLLRDGQMKAVSFRSPMWEVTVLREKLVEVARVIGGRRLRACAGARGRHPVGGCALQGRRQSARRRRLRGAH